MVAVRLAEDQNAGLVSEDQIVDNREDSGAQSERAPRKLRKTSKRKSPRIDPLAEVAERYEKELKSVFKEYATDRIFDGFQVDCKVSFSTEPGVLIICATLRKNERVITRVMRPVLSYPDDVRMVSVDLYSAMELWGLSYAEHIGV
jgi:hypothetical protein